MIDTFFPKGGRLHSQRGDTLIEVVISALLTGLIVVAVLTGFNETNKVSQDERSHNQASVLAAQSQEQLRSDPASTLDTLASTPHEYNQAVGGTTYKIKQSAEFVNGSSEVASCTNSKNEAEASKYVEVTSSVDWHALEAVNRSPVTQSSIITPPDGSGLEVDVTNLASPEEGVPGVTVLSGGVETTTGSKGCVIYAGIPATTANIEAYKKNYVTPGGEHKVVAKEISIAPNVTTHYHVNLAEGGKIKAEFRYKGAAAEGDTFVAFNNKMGVAPEFEVGSPRISYNSEGEYEAETGSVNGTTEGYAHEATTAVDSSYYGHGDLFPFTTAWTVYAGDCTENNPLKDKVSPGEAIVPAGGEPLKPAKVPMSYVTLDLYSSNGTGTPTKETTPQEVKITNLSCTDQSPEQGAVNAIKANYEHRQMTNTEGHLTVPYQPFGRFEICLAYNNSSTHRTYVDEYETNTEEGTTLENVYAGSSKSNLPWKIATTSNTTVKC
jgi:Tfp pilus assembly protein PilV